jgi:hypothetical protein
MNKENQRLVTDWPVEFEKEPVEVQEFRRITDHFRGNLWNMPQVDKEKITTCYWLDLETLQF